MGNTNHKHIAIAGPTSVGKGYTGKHIIDALGEEKVWMIVLGKLIVDRMNRDAGFREQCCETVRKGELLPYEVVTPMVEESYKEGIDAGFEVFCWDGYARDKRQAERLLQIWDVPRIGEANYRFFMLRASRATCKSRLDEAIVSGRRSNRGDNHVFDDRYNLHKENEPGVIKTIEGSGGFVKVIDANKPLETVARSVLISLRQIVPFKHSTSFENRPSIATRTECSQQSLVAA
ncbi:MAG: hypothetical protein EB170_07770 [Nitrosopumilaceae archaeon]|nr:hypothetical protein [Nitrosopumilaceae archaeon]